jgi:DNA-binding NarL/FixJ family response regulator
MPGPADRAEDLARELGQAMAAGGPLTRREREITRLVADGLTNRAIADRLVLSERTVEGHIRSILAKLQLTNRTWHYRRLLTRARRERRTAQANRAR